MSTPAARLFRLLSLHPGPDVTAPAAAALAGLTPAEGRALLAELTSASLTAERPPGRYLGHDLLRAYAGELAATVDAEPDRGAATRRLFEHYLHRAHAANRLLDPAADPGSGVGPGSGVDDSAGFGGYRAALDWFTAERAVLLNVVDRAARDGWPVAVEELVQAVAVFLDRRGHWHDALTVWGIAARSADPVWQARAHRQMGRAYTRLYRFDDAGAHLRTALDLAARAGDRTEQAHVNHTLAILCERRGDLGRAVGHDHRMLALYREVGHRRGEAKAHNSLGWHLSLLGDHEQALVCCERALGLLRELRDRPGQANTLDSLGHAHHHLGHTGRALACYRRALALNREVGDRFGEAEVLDHLGDLYDATGDAAGARRSWRRAADILVELAHPGAVRVRAKLGPVSCRRSS